MAISLKRVAVEFLLWLLLVIAAIGACLYILPGGQLPDWARITIVWVVAIGLAAELVLIVLRHYWRYATNMDVPAMQIEQRENAVVKQPDELRTAESLETIHQAVLSLTTEEDYQLLLEKAKLGSRQTKIVANRDRFSLLQLPDYQYATIVDLTLLNDAKGINRRFCIVNQKLPDNGRYVCCYRPQEYIKQKILSTYPKGINWVVYFFYFLRKRVIPRLLLTSRLYYDITKGRKRMLSKTEVLGRLYYCCTLYRGWCCHTLR